MFRQPAPRPMHIIAASYLASAAATLYVEFVGRSLDPGSPAQRADIDAGDRLTSLKGRPFRSTLDWIYALGFPEAGRPMLVGLERGGESLNCPLWDKRPEFLTTQPSGCEWRGRSL